MSCDLCGRVAVLLGGSGAFEFLREWSFSGSVSLIKQATTIASNTGNTPKRKGTPLNSSFC